MPKDPLKLGKKLQLRLGTSTQLDDLSQGQTGETQREFYGLYYSEKNGGYRFRVAFPVWAERTQPSRTQPKVEDRASLFGGLYYNRRSAERADDVLFPLFWNMRDLTDGSRTTVVGPLVNRVAPGERDNWLAPLYFTGKRKHGGYTIIPPLFTYTRTDADGRGGFNLVGPMLLLVEGRAALRSAHGPTTSISASRPSTSTGRPSRAKYELIPPLLHYYRYDDRDRDLREPVGPVLPEAHRGTRDLPRDAPVLEHLGAQTSATRRCCPSSTTVTRATRRSSSTRSICCAKGEEGESTFVTWGYARYRGRTKLDMITPLYWHYRDPDIGLDQKLFFPFLYSRTSPRESNQVFFPFWGHFERYGVSETTWITPFFQHTTDLRGWQTNIHPILYLGRSGNSSHTVVAPFFWDFVDRDSRATVGFPVYWRFSDRDSVNQLVGNVYYREKKLSSGLDWEIHVFPAFSYGETPDGHWWNVLYGLAGYTRRGDLVKMRTLWIPITLSGEEKD